jgi:hypothetical protein
MLLKFDFKLKELKLQLITKLLSFYHMGTVILETRDFSFIWQTSDYPQGPSGAKRIHYKNFLNATPRR